MMFKRVFTICLAFAGITASAQQPPPPAQLHSKPPNEVLSWEQVRERFEVHNPTLLAGKLNVDESKAEEITAFLRPNPTLGVSIDQIDPFNGGASHGPFAYLLNGASVDYLFERRHKRDLRRQSAQEASEVAVSTQEDLERTLLFNLRSAFVGILQAKAVRAVALDNLSYYDRLLGVSREQYKAGGIAQMDLDRLELQRVQYESDLETAEVNLRTTKIQMLALLNERTPVDEFDVAGVFDFPDAIPSLDEVRKVALDSRPDLKAAMQSVEKARTDHKLAVADGSTDPTLGFDVGRNPPIDAYFGVSVSIPLRIFDRNQGEKKRTQIDIERNEHLLDAAQAQVFSEADSAYASVDSALTLLRPYKAKYLQQAVRVRDAITFSYQHGGASLLDFLSAENDYRAVELNYANLIGSYLMAAGQLNQAAGHEVIP
jgi:outer membrane protein, heavy metal efflux system